MMPNIPSPGEATIEQLPPVAPIALKALNLLLQAFLEAGGDDAPVQDGRVWLPCDPRDVATIILAIERWDHATEACIQGKEPNED